MPERKHTRERKLPKSFKASGRVEYRPLSEPNGKWQFIVPGYDDLSGRQKTVSEGHHWPLPDSRKGLRDEGGPFFTTRSYVDFIDSSIITTKEKSNGLEKKFTGSVYSFRPSNPDNSVRFPKSAHSSDSELAALGAEAIARCKPTNSVADAATFFGEIMKDGLPRLPGISLWERKMRVLVGAGSEFLNAVFAWAPTIKDVKEISQSIVRATETMRQYERDNGKVVRRRYDFKLEKEESEFTEGDALASARCQGTMSGNFKDPNLRGQVVCKRVVTRKRWFTGAFTYHIPTDKDSWQRMLGIGSSAEKALGSALDPTTLWELTPWSWAIDWFTNAQEVLENLQSFEIEGLILRYGYLMEESIVKETYTMTKNSGITGVPLSSVPPITLVTETKKRIQASPYGFGITWEGLSTLQIAILAAIGITRRS